MANTKEAVENVKSLARTFQSVIDLANSLDGLASVEQATQEANIQRVNLLKEVENLQSRFDELSVDYEELVKSSNEVKELANKQAKDIIEKANEYYQTKSREVDEYVVSQKDISNEMLKVAQSKLDDIQAKTEQANIELNDIEAKVERAKAKMRELLGA